MAKLSKKTANKSLRFNIPETGFFPINKLISSTLRTINQGGLIYNNCFNPTFLYLTNHG
jgi:hypothetical protein